MANRLSILNPHPRKIPGPELLHELVPNEVGSGGVAAIEYLSPHGTIEHLSYSQLNRRANAFAQTLRSTWERATATSIAKHFIAPIFISQCPELYISELGALKAGAAFCPISLDVPEERLRFILHDVDAKILITTTELRDGLPDLEGVTVISVDDIPSENDDENFQIDITPSQPAYIMYTSGSTGQPKGVVLSHSAATQALLAHERHIPKFSRFLQFANPTFDVSVFEIFFPLSRGCTVVSGERRQMLNDLPRFINRMDIDAAELTPSVASSLLHGRASVPTLRVLLTIGEMLKRDVVEEFGGTLEGNGVLYGMYGPTEATIHCTSQTSFSKTMSVGNIGVPLDTVSAFIVRPASSGAPSQEGLYILPVGEEGELAVGGHQLADGYLNRVEQTTTSFVRHPDYGMLYRTGDRARLTSFGTLECLGRISGGQVKLRGQRVELGEIEYAASKAPGMRSVVADIIDGNLVIFCLGNTSTSVHHVREACRGWLPVFMVPADIVLLNTLPYLSSGKIDRKALLNLYSEKKRSSSSNNGRMTSRNRRIIDIISDVLRFPIDNQTQLAAVGFDSLSSIRVASELQRSGFPQLDAVVLLESETVQDVESQLNRLEATSSPSDQYDDADISSRLREAVSNNPALSERLEEIDDVFAPTSVQSAMLSETARDSQAYCNWVELSVSSQEIDKVRNCLQDLAAQHVLLRAGFLNVNIGDATHVIIVWRDLLPDQISTTDRFDYGFVVQTEEDLLHPCTFQLIEGGNEVRILLKIHHALYDQWSLDVLRSDLAALLLGWRIPSCPSFRTIARFHQTNLQHFRSEPVADFWQDLLRDFVPISLPLMNGTRVPRNLQRTQWHRLTIDLSSIRRMSRDLGCSAPTIFQAAMSYLLGCYTGSADVTFGVVFSGRHLPLPGMEGVFGPCLTTLPLRVDYTGARTCSDLLRLIRTRNLDMQKNALTPLSHIKRTQDCAPGVQLFDTLFVWQETSLPSRNDKKFVQEVDSADHHEYNLVLEFEPRDDDVWTRVTYQQALISSSQVNILVEQIKIVSESMVNDPHSLVQKLGSCLPHNLLSISNPSPTHCATGRSLVTAVENNALESPHSPALIFAKSIGESCAETETMNYTDLNIRSNRMARHLQSLSVLPDELVCICMEKSVDMYIGILATIKAGAGYLPLTPDTPISRLKSILGQSQVKVCLCDGHTAPMFESVPMDMVIDVTSLNLLHLNANNLAIHLNGSQVAYTVFTSGSTGEPKGVVVTLENLQGNLEALQNIYKVKSGDRLLQACSQAFDVSAFEIFFAFYTGICLCSASKDVLFEDLEASIRALRISHLSLTPTVAALVDPRNVPDVRFLVTAGEGITDLVHQRWAGKGLHQGYGPSETTNICTVNMNVSPNDVLANIGRPLRNTSAFVVSTNSAFNLLPSGSVGEFAFGGEQVFRGYVGRDTLNAEKIIDHPNLGRIYRSGDIGRILPDGSLLISGRIDDQIKVRGNRVELGEISSVLLSDPDVRDCATILDGHEAPNQTLASFFVPERCSSRNNTQTQAISLEECYITRLFDRLEASLPSYMIPNFVIPIKKLPLTSQGKLDKHELGRLLQDLPYEAKSPFTRSSGDTNSAENWGMEESQIAEALKETLQISDANLTPNKSFFSFGLNSLNAIAFAKLLASRLQIRVNVSSVLHSSTITRLARTLKEESAATPSSVRDNVIDMLPAGVVEDVRTRCASFEQNIKCILPCTPLQEAMLSSGSAKTHSTYCNSLSLRINGDLLAIKRCWRDMVKRHSILRTHFVSTSNPEHPYVQVVLKDLPLPWREQNLDISNNSAFSEGYAGNVASMIVKMSKPFCVDVHTSARGTKLILHMHHAIYDEISMSRLLGEVEIAYRGKVLPAPTSFAPFLTEIQRQSGQDAIAFWSAQIEGFKPKPFPVVHSSEPAEEVVLETRMPISHSDLDSYCRRHAVSHVAVFQAALVKVMACAQGAQDICFGNVVSGRTVPVERVDTLVAPCFNTVPVRTKLTGTGSNTDLIRQLNSKNIDILSYQLTPLRRIQRFSSSPSKRLFDALLILQPRTRPVDPTIWDVEKERGSMGLPLVFEVIPKGDRYELVLHFLHPGISRELACSTSQTFSSALISCLKYPHGDVGHFEGTDNEKIAGTLFPSTLLDDGLDASNDQSNHQWTGDEAVIRRVFSELAGVREDDIATGTSLYHLGLDSLNAPQVASRLRALGFVVDAADVMETLTTSSLAALIRAKSSPGQRQYAEFDLEAFDRERRDAVLESLHVDNFAVEAIRPCTSVQSGMLAQSLASDGRLYVNHVTYAVPDSFSGTDFQAAWSLIRARHQVLRIGFHQHEAQNPFEMVIFYPYAIPIPFTEVEGVMQLEEVEYQASKAIMEALHTRPWQITMQYRSGGNIMTLSLHHALYDGESLGVILSDFAKALCSSEPQPQTNIDALLQSTLAAEADRDGQAAEYWREVLQNISGSKFPDLTPTVVQDRVLQSECCICSLPISSAESFCRANGATVQALGQTAWALLLAAYTSDENVMFGTIFAGQTTSAARGVPFPCITTIPVPCKTNCSPWETIHSMVSFNALSQRHRFAPLSGIQRFAGHAGRTLFDTVFVYRKSSFDSVAFDWPVVQETAGVDYVAALELESMANGEMSICLRYNTSNIPPQQAVLMVQQYDYILTWLVSSQKRQAVASEPIWSRLPALEPDLPSNIQLLHDFVEQSASTHPDRIALEFVQGVFNERVIRKTWTYEQLDGITNQVAHLIQQSGVQPNSMVAVCMDKCPEASFAFVGILKAGCSFLTIDPELPGNRLKFILEDSSARLLLGDQEDPPLALPESVKYVTLRESLLTALPKTQIPQRPVSSNATCYCLYTSGTTGTPKGCEISHQNAVQAMLAFQRLFAGRWTESSRWLQFASYWFDVSILEQFWSWGVGITVVGAPRDLVLEDLPGFLRRLNITHIDLTPSLARLLHPNDASSLWNGVFITGGEPLKQEIIDAWGAKKTICNGYGPTEATIGVTMNTFIGSDAKPSNIGRQFDNVGTYVLQPESDELVLRGTVGELCVSGKLVGKGYLNRPDLTARHFPFLERFGETVYRTGDLVRMLADGSFAFIGRADSQAKLRGQRLELTEIENVLRGSSDEINEVVSLVIKTDEEGKETLVSFLAMAARGKAEKLQFEWSERSRQLVQVANEACTSQLPGYMVPTHILAINHLPLTVNNKADIKQLVARFNSASTRELRTFQNSGSNTRPLNETEQKIYEALERLVRIGSVDITGDSNLFSLGLSSISVIAFSSLLKQAGFPNASIATIMRNPSLEQLGYALLTNPNPQQEDHSVKQALLQMTAFHHRYLLAAAKSLSVPVDDIETVAPCTPLQQGLIIESLRDENKPHFNDFRYIIDSSKIPQLKLALEELVNAAQVLRTRFIDTDEGFAQVVLHRARPTLSEWSVPPDDVEIFLSELKAQWLVRNDLALLVPFEFHLIEAATRSYFVVHIHHALYDGVSYGLMFHLLSEICHSGLPVDLGPSFTTALSHGPLRCLPDAEHFWRRRLEGVQYVPLPRAAGIRSPGGSMVTFRLEDKGSMETTRKQLGVSHQALMQSCFEIALRQSAPSAKVYGLVSSGRSIELRGADRVLGPMFNTLPQPLDLKLDPTLSEHVHRCHSLNVETIPFQHTPLRDIWKWSGQQLGERMFDILFVFQPMPNSGRTRIGKLLQPVERTPRAYYPLACEAELAYDGSLSVTLLAQKAFFDQKALEDFRGRINHALDCIIHRSNESLQDVFELTTSESVPKPLKKHTTRVQVNGVQGYEWTEPSKRMREVLSQLSNLDIDDIDEHSTIFSLGLDSIDAVKLASRLRHLEMSIPVSRILQAQTIPGMLQALDESSPHFNTAPRDSKLQMIEQQMKEASVSASLLNVEDVERILPATPHQEALIADMLRSELREYFNHDVLRLHPNTDLDRLKSAWKRVVDATPILRTSFLEMSDPHVDAVFAQVVHPRADSHFAEYKCSDFEGLEDIFNSIREDVLAKFRSSPPLRLTITTIDSERYLIFSMAHAQYDGHSLALLHEDVRRAYDDNLQAHPPYDDAIKVALTGTQDDARAYWNSMLTGARTHSFPRRREDKERSKVHRLGRYSKTSSAEARSFCQKQCVSMQALAQTCWAVTLANYVRDLDVLFGVVLACRDSEEREQVMFPMMNTVVLRSTLHGSREQMLQYMQSMITDMLPYQRTPLRTIQAAGAKVVRQGASELGNRLFDTLFIYQHRPDTAENGISSLYESVGGSSNVEYAVAVEMEAVGQKLVIRAACKGNVLDELGTADLLDQIESVLRAIITSPEEPTVEFEGDKVSISGLKPVSLRTTDHLVPKAGSVRLRMDDKLGNPSPPLISAIVQVLADVSKTPIREIALNSTIESIGVDSISAIKVAALLRKQSIEISVSEIIRTKTPARMSEIASTWTDQCNGDELPSNQRIAEAVQRYVVHDIAAKAGLDARNIEAVIPATAGQVYMISMSQKTRGQLFYSTFPYRLETELSMEQIKQAWAVLIDRHAILRTVFCATTDSDLPLLQVVLNDAPESFVQNSGGTGAKSANQPMVCLRASKNDTGYLLELTIHHALYDAVSLPLLMQDFQSLLARTSSLRSKLKFEDFISLSLTPRARQARKDFWTRCLQGLKPLQLSQPTIEGAQRRVEVFKPGLFSGAAKLEIRARKEGVSIQAFLFAAYAKLYAGLVDKGDAIADGAPSDVILGIYFSNRSHLAELDTLPVPTLNIVPLIVRAPQQKSLRDVAKEVHLDLQSITTAENSAVGLWEIYEWTGVKVDTFVNFIKLPERSDQCLGGDGKANVVLEALDDRRMQERHQVVEAEKEEFEVPTELKELSTDAYQHSLDIEMTITDGKLGVGFFCPEAMVGLEEAGQSLEELKGFLEKTVGKTKE